MRSIRLDEKEVVDATSKSWLSVAVMLSLLLQLLLLLTGGTRKWNRGCRFVAWNAYNWSDYVATTALGGLAHAVVGDDDAHRKEVYAIWAPILLLHLGAPDNISAYAMADAELWKRHGLTMLLQITIVVYVVANCAHSWKFVLLSVCLTALGSIKYAERMLALKRASRADITESALPIYKYMLVEAGIHLDIKGPVSSSDVSQPADARTRPTYYYILQGEKQWLRNFLRAGETGYVQNYSDAAKSTPELVTLEDILSSHELTSQMPSIVSLCVGFALFKLYKRRLCNLYMYEWREAKTRELFLGEHMLEDIKKLMFVRELFLREHVLEDMKELMFALDVELRFLFDSLYTKAGHTAFSKTGVSFRVLTTIVLMVSAVFILGGSLDLHDQAIEQAREVTFCLISAAIIIEVYQLARLVLSDWCKVWLACRYILVGEKLKKKSSWCCCLGGFWLPSLILKAMKLSSSIGRHEYWTNRIGQYAIIESRKSSTWQMVNAKLAGLLRPGFLQVWPEYEQSKPVLDEFRKYVLSRVVKACRQIGLHEKVVSMMWFLPRYEPRDQFILQEALGTGGYSDFEHLAVTWHVATCVCELLATPAAGSMQQHIETDEEEDMRVSKLLSRYLMYLIVHKAELLPCHSDIARQLAGDTQRDMRGSALIWEVESITVLLGTAEQQDNHLPFNLRAGMRAASHLQTLAPVERWRLIGSLWVDILVCAAGCNKPAEQLQQLTLGGEFLTHLWVLLGHLGCGDQ